MWIADGLTLELAVERLKDLIPLLVLVVVGTTVLEVGVYLFFGKLLKSKYTLPYTLVAPAAVALLLFTIYPFVYNIRLAFSDLRLKTISCYIPNNEITNVPCSLSQAAPGAEVAIQVNQIAARTERNENATVAFTLEKGDKLKVTGREFKIEGYMTDTGNAVELVDDGTGRLTLGVKACSPIDRECVLAYQKFQRLVLANQDERDWWPVEKDGQQGWIPNKVDYVVTDAPVYLDMVGEALLEGPDGPITVQQGQEVRLSAAETKPTQWVQVQLGDGQTGWINAESVVSSQSFFPEAEATIYKRADTTSEVVTTLAAGSEAQLLQRQTLTWYQVLVGTDQFGWINIPVRTPSTITVVTVGTGAPLYALDADLTNLEGVEPIGQIEAGDELIQLMVDNATSADTTWYQVETQDGTVGYTTATPLDTSEVEVLVLSGETPLYEGVGSDTVRTSIADGARVRLIERNKSEDVDWFMLRTADGQGWTQTGGETVSKFAVTNDLKTDTLDAYAAPGAVGGAVGTVAKGQALDVVDPQPTTFARYRVVILDDQSRALVDAEGFPVVGWLDQKPDAVISTEREPVLYSLDYGWENFKRVFVKENTETGKVEGWGRLLQTQNSTFPRLMRITLAWTSLNVIFHLIVGMILALMLNRPNLRLRGIYRAIIILPWAIPQPIIAMAWRGEFHYQFGFVNTLLTNLGLEPVSWLFATTPAFIAVTFVNIWLGIPFYMVTLLGGLQSIAGDYYEAAEIDGANAWQRFRNVTVPLIRPVAVPIVTLDVIWTFNNFNVIYLVSRGEPNESTNILVTALYNAAFGTNGQFQLGFAAAFSLVIFAVLFMFAVVWVTSSGALKGVYDK